MEVGMVPMEMDFPNDYFVFGKMEEKGCKEIVKRVVQMV